MTLSLKCGCALLVAFIGVGCAQWSAAPIALDDQIRQELDALGRAVVNRNTGEIERRIATEFTFTQPNGIVSGRRELLAQASSADGFVYTAHRVLEIRARGYDGTAVSTGQFFVSGSYRGQPIDHHVRFTAVHVHRDGRWQLVALHSTIK